MQICNSSSSTLARVKPQDLRFPYTFEERIPTLHEGMLFLPPHFYDHDRYGLKSWYPSYEQYEKIYIEYCSGNGTWVLERAKQDPSILWIGIERRWDRARKIWVKMKNQGIENCLIVLGDAEIFNHHYLKEELIDAIFVNFPDPWPKIKHAGNRLFQAPFICDLARSIKTDHPITIVTDDSVYTQQILMQFNTPSWVNPHLSKGYLDELEGYGSSFFEELWRSKGLSIHYMQFYKKVAE